MKNNCLPVETNLRSSIVIKFTSPRITSYILHFVLLLTFMVKIAKAEEFDVQLTPSLYAGGYNVSCYGASSGAINVFISGGTSPYTFVWSDGSTVRNRSNLAAGYYNVIVTSANGSSVTRELTLTQPDVFQVILHPSERAGGYNISENGGNDGLIDAEVQGGVPPYTFLWSNGIAEHAIGNLIAGNYSITVHDATNCTAMANVTLIEPTPFHIVSIVSPTLSGSNYNTSCRNDNGSINLTVAGGAPPYNYRWSNGALSQNLNNVASGNYEVEVTDDLGTAIRAGIILTNSPTVLATISAFVYPNGKNTSCYTCTNGSITLSNIFGQAPFTYRWNSGQTSQNLTNVAAGAYTVTITDALGCDNTRSIVLQAPEREVWTMAGNTSIDTTKFIGTTDAKDLIFKTNNSERLKLLSNGDLKLSNLVGSGERYLKISANGIVGVSGAAPAYWQTRGNDFISTSDYIGTKNNTDLIIKTNTNASSNGGERARFTSDGHVIFSNLNQLTDDLLTVEGNTKINGNIEIGGDLKFSTLNLSSTELLQVGTNGIISHTPFPSASSLNYWTKSTSANELKYIGKVGINNSAFASGISFQVLGNTLLDGNVSFTGAINVPSSLTSNDLVQVDASNNLKTVAIDVVNYWKATSSSIGAGQDISYNNGGSVGIGIDPVSFTNQNRYKLMVNGSIGAKEVIIRAAGPWPDFVFATDYKLKNLNEVERYLSVHKHLPDMPSAAQIETEGQSLAELQKLQQQKLEELFLYVLQLQKEIEVLKSAK